MNQAMQTVLEKLQSWGDSVVAMLPNLIVALLVVGAAALIAKMSRRLTVNAAKRLSAQPTVRRLLGTLMSLSILAVGLFVALGVLKLDKTVTSLLAGAGVLGLAVGFAAQNAAANFLSGVMISLRRPYKEGDLIETNSHFGTVDRVDLRVTRLRTPQGQLVLVPNKEILEQPLVNFSAFGRRRVDLVVGVSYGDDLETARQIALDALADLDKRSDDEVEFFYDEFGGSSINFTIRFWVPFARQSDFLAARSEAVMRIKKAFDDHGITIPFPIRTLDFGIEGGTTLTEALEARGRTGLTA